MARNIAGYISNLGKSVAYSTVDKVKTMSPTTGDFVSTNAELFKSMYSNIRDYKGTYTRGLGIIKKTKIYEAADLGMKSIFEDIKTGKFYNKEREDKIASKIMGFGDDSSSGFGSFDMNDDFDSDFEDNDFGSFGEGVTTGDKIVSASIIDSSRSNAEMISMSVARSAQHITETQKASTHLLYTQNLQAYNLFNSNLTAMNNNISNILNFSTSTLQTQAQNATKYYEETTKLMQDQTALLRQILEAVSPTKEQQKEQKRKTTFSDVVGANGAPDLREYGKIIKKNISDQFGALGAMNSMFGDDSNALLSLVSSPLKFIPNMIVNKMVPATVEKAMGEFDKSLSGFFGSLISKFNTMAKDEDNIFTSTIGKIFGIKNNVKSSIDTSNYNKGKVDWDGKSRKALIEVIPTQLAKIVSLLSGKPEKIYDYDRGTFIDSSEIKNMLKNMRKGNAKRATSDMRDTFDSYMKNLTFSSLDDKETLEGDIEKFFEYMYSNGELFNMFGKNSKDDYLKYGINSKSYAIIKAMFKNADKHLQHSINKDIIEYRDRENKDMMDLEQKADSIIQYMFNNSSLGEFSDGKKKNKGILSGGGLLDSLDNKGKNVFFYLQNIYKELSFIRRYSGGMSSSQSSTIMTDYDSYTSYNGGHTMDDIVIKDSSKKSEATIKREERQRKIAAFERGEKKRKEKNKSLIDISNIDDERELENILSSTIKFNRFKDDLKEKDEKKKTLLDRLLEAENISGKAEVVIDNLNRISKKPMDFIVNTLNKVDQRMYEVIYGKESANGDTKGFIDELVLQLKNTFGQFNLWLDEKVLMPLKEKLDIEKFSDIGKKFLGAFGIDVDEIRDSIKKNLTGEDSFLGEIKKSIKGSLKNAFSTVKQSMKDAYGPLFNRAKNYLGAKNKFTDLDDVSRDFEGANEIDWRNTDDSTRLQEWYRQQSLKPSVNSDQGLRRSIDFYKGFDFSTGEESKEKKLKYINANIKYLEKLSNPTKEEKEELKNLIYMKNRIITLDKYKESRNFGKISVNEDYFNRPRKSSSELYEMFPGLVHSPEIGAKVEEYNQKDSNKLFDTIFNRISEGIDYLKSMKDSLIQIVQSINPRSKDTKGFMKPSVFNNVSTPFSSNPLLKEEDMAIENFAKELGGIISGSIANYIRGNTKKYASGGYIEKAQVATIGRGEVVLSKEDTENLVSILGNLMDNISNQEKSKLANTMYNNSALRTLDKKLGGIKVEDYVYGNKDLHDKYNSLSDEDKSGFNKVSSRVLSQLQDDRDTVLDKDGLPVDPVKRAAFQEARPYIQKVGDEFTKGVSVVRNALFGNSVQEDKKSFGLFMDDVTTNITRYAPEAIGSGLLGAGVSLITGAFGGPLLGAAVGAGISLTKNSEKAQDWLFGQRDEEGNRKGGIIPKNFMNSITKYLPDLKTYGIAGAATGLLPLVPFGPIGGLILGSGIAFAKKNQAIQDALFGESDGLFKPETKNKIKKMLPRMGLGVAGSLMFGPFGFLGNTLLGSGLGMLSTTDKFQQMILGEKDKEGKYQGGLLPTLRDNVVDPIKGYMKGLGSRISEFIQEKMFKPLASAFEPMKKTVELLTKGMFDKVGNFMNNMFEKSFGVPLNKLIEEKLVKPITGFIGKWILRPLKGGAKALISSPFKAIGAMGNSLRKAHIRSGNADYMTAQERLQFRQDKNIYTMGLFGDDRFYETDKQLAGMDDDSLGLMLEQLQNIKNDKKTNLANRKASAEDMAKDIIPHFGYTESKNIMRHLRDGKFDDVIDYINKNPKLSQETKQALRKSLYDKNKTYQERESKRSSDIENKDSIFAQLRKQGIDVNDKNIDKYINMLSKEGKARKKGNSVTEEKPIEEQQLDLQEKNHNEIVDLFKETIELLRDTKNENKKPETEDNIREVIDDDGSVRIYKRNSRGKLEVDSSDHTSVSEVKQEQVDERNKSTFYERMNEMFQKGKDKFAETTDTVKEKSGNFLSDLMGAVSGASKFLSIGSLIAAGIMAFMKTGDGKNMLLSVAKTAAGWFTSAIGSGLKTILPDSVKKLLGIEGYGEGGAIDTAATAVGYDGASGVGSEIANTGVRQIVTGGSLKGGGLLSKVFKSGASNKGVIGKALYYANPINMAKEAVKLGGRTAGRAVNGAANLANKLYDKVGLTKVKDLIVEKGFKGVSKVASTVKDAAGNSELIQSMIKSMKNFMEKLFTNKTVVGILGDKAEVMLTKFVPNIIKEVTERAAKASTSAITKVIGGMSTGGLLNVIWAAADFVSGFNNCKDILGIVQEPTFGMKVGTGILKALNGLFIITSFIPEKTWVNLIMDFVLPLFGAEDTNLQKLREESKQIVEKYSQETGTEATIEEYNKQNKKGFIKTITDGTKSLFSKVKSWFGGKGNSTTSTTTTSDYSSVPDIYNLTGNQSIYSVAGKGSSKPKTIYSGFASKGVSSRTQFAGKGASSSSGFPFAGKGVGENDIKYMELNAPIKDTITAKDINDWVNPLAGNSSGMYNIGDAAIKAQNQTGLDARYLVAHAAQETGWGKSQMAREKNNFFGIGAFNDSPDSALSFSKENGFIEGAKWINHNFTSHGQNTLHSMINSDGHRYAVFDDGSPNTEWMSNIANIMYNSGSITSGSINKNAKWDGEWADSNYSSSSSSAKDGSSSTEEEATGGSLFNAFTDLGTALSNDFNRIFGFDTSSSDSSSNSSSSDSSDSSTSEGEYTSKAGRYTAKKLNGFTYFSQSEDPWASYIYRPSGGGMFSDPTIKDRGCGTTSAAMVIRELTGNKEVDPASMADYSTDAGTSVEAGTAWSFFSKAGNKYGLNVKQSGVTASTLSNVNKNNPMVISGTGGPGSNGAPFYGGHFVVGVKGNKDSITINDPLAQSASKTYKISEILPYMQQGWSFDKGGGKGASMPSLDTPKAGKGPTMNLPSKVTNIIQNTSSTSGNFEKILLSIVEILIKISDNSNYLSKIVEILSNTLGVNIPEDTKKSIQSNATGAKQSIVNVIKQSVSESNPDNEYLLNLLDTLATQ